ncbi:MAG: endonuclease III [Nitrospinota bacterium]|nr:endonuclease III [Nitrospinota bacterium]
MERFPIDKVVNILREEIPKYKEPIVGKYAKERSPFKVLISTLLSLRTKDQTTAPACDRLFAVADSPERLAALPPSKIEKLIYPVGFYKVKARTVISVCRVLLEKYDGRVPDSLDELLTIKGVGRKTANLVVTLGYGKPGICVDIHVHRISNRWGYIKTAVPDESEFELRRILPKKFWIEYNDLLVTYGQNLCVPVSPFCSQCRIERYCKKVGVKSRR